MTCWSKLPRKVMEDLVQPQAAQQRKERERCGSRAGRGSDLPDKAWGNQVHPTVQITVQDWNGESSLRSSLEIKTASQGLGHWYTLGMVELPYSLGRDQGQESHLESISRDKKVPPMRLLTDLVQNQFWFWTAAKPGAQAVKPLGNGGGYTRPLIHLCL